MHGRMLSRFEYRFARRKQRLNVAFGIKKVHVAGCHSPLDAIGRAKRQTRDALRLAIARNRAVRICDRGVAQKYAAQLKDTHALGAAIAIELQNL